MANKEIKAGSLEGYFRGLRNDTSSASSIPAQLEGEFYKKLQFPNDVDENTFALKYILVIIRDFVKDPYGQDILLAVYGLLNGYLFESVGARRNCFCENVGIYDEECGKDVPFNVYWKPGKGNDPFKKHLDSKENVIIGKLSVALRDKMRINKGSLGYIDTADKIEGITFASFPDPNYLRGVGYRKCSLDGKTFYVPLTKAERLQAASALSMSQEGCGKITPIAPMVGSRLVGAERPIYTVDQIDNGILGDTITFNSVTDGIIGDERHFVGVREYQGPNLFGFKNTWHNSLTVKDGQEYILRLFVHNNNPNGARAVAQDVKVAFGIPIVSDNNFRIYGRLAASNATPSEYWDYVELESSSKFHLEYVYGSALLENHGIGKNGVKLGDKIVTAASKNGTWIAYDSLEDTIPGGESSVSYVTIRVKTVFDTDFRVVQKVRILGDNTWHNYVDVKVGDRIEFQTQYKNTDFRDNTHENVTMRAVLPKNLKYIAGSTLLFTARTPDGMEKEDGIAGNGIYIGTYGVGSNVCVRFTAEVVDENLADGTTGLVNWVQASVNGVMLQDFTTICVMKE